MDAAGKSGNDGSETSLQESGYGEAVATFDDFIDAPEEYELEAYKPTSEDVVASQDTGIELTVPDEETITPAPDGGKGWLVVFCCSILLCIITVHPEMQTETLKFVGQPEPSSTASKKDPCESNWPDTSSLSPDELLSTLVTRLVCGDESLGLNISVLLQSLNRSHEFENILFLARPQEYDPDGDRGNGLSGVKKQNRDALVADATNRVTTTESTMNSIFGIVSGTLIMVIGYRLVAMAGSFIIAVGCLGAAFCDNSNLHLVTFLYGALPGMGINMVYVSLNVAIIEYFDKRRLTALLIPYLISNILKTLMPLVTRLFLPLVGMVSWRSCLLLQAGFAAPMLLASLGLKPLKSKVKDDGATLISRIIGIEGLAVFRKPTLYIYALIWFLWFGAFTLITSKLPEFKGLDLIPILPVGMILNALLLSASVLGLLITCCLPRGIRLNPLLIALTVHFSLVGLLNLLTSQLYNFIYALIFSILVGLFKGITEPLLVYAIPLVVGEDNMQVGTGVMAAGQGVGGLVMAQIGDVIHKGTGIVDGCFYLSGALLVLCSVASLCLHHLNNRARQVAISPAQQNT